MQGKIIILSAPSGSGKSTIIKQIIDDEALRLGFSVSATSRAPRGQEKDGVDYYFISDEEFLRRIDAGDFVEWEEVYAGTHYGTLASEVERVTGSGRNLIMDIDVKGGVNVKKRYGSRALSIFIMPPSLEVLSERLHGRGTDSEEVIARRLAKAEYELSFAPEYDLTVVNDNLNAAVSNVRKAISEFIASLMRIAVYSGSFDPVHNGHVALAEYVAALPDVDEVWLLVTPHNPLKPLATSATFEQRMEMTRMAVAGVSEVRVMDFEAQLPPPHFTYSTLCALRARFPEHSFSLLIGSDNWQIFSSWRNHAEIIKDFGLLVYPRPGYETDTDSFPPQVRYLKDAPTSAEASTEIRTALASSPLPNNSIPADVYTYINTHRLYGRNQDKP